MTQDDIIRLSREIYGPHKFSDGGLLLLERFAALVIAAERDACIALCEEHWRNSGNSMECADAIRARSEE